MKRQFMAGMMIGALLLVSARAGETQVVAPENVQRVSVNTNHAAVRADAGESKRNTGHPGKYSPGVEKILTMMKAGVSTEVIKVYIESSPVAYNLTPADLIALKKRGVPDELTAALLRRGATLRAQAAQRPNPRPAARIYLRRQPYSGGLDPESYQYFQYYYLYPRTLAAANQRLLTPYAHYPGLAPYPYGAYGALAFRQFAPPGFGPP